MKKLALHLHLWTGLVFGTILVVLGLTGSALSWMHELDAMLNPGFLHVAPPHGVHAGDPMRIDPALIESVIDVLTQDPRYGKPGGLEMPARGGEVFIARYRAVPGEGNALWAQSVSRQVMVDPATLRVTGERHWGEFGLSRPLLMPTLFHIHRYLVAGETGKVIVAVTGVSLLLMVLTGMVLWWPRMAYSALRKALTIRHGGSWPRFSFQLHRAGGFFAAPVLLVLALSGIYFNMPEWVTPVVNSISPVTPTAKVLNRSEQRDARIPAALAIATAQKQFPAGRVSRLSLPAKSDQPYEIRLRQPGELREGPGATRISVDSGDASVLRVIDPVKVQGGNKVLSWMFPLHTGEAFGLPGRIFITLFGFVPLAFMATGLVIWVKLRKKNDEAVIKSRVQP